MSNQTPSALTYGWIFDITSYIMYTAYKMRWYAVAQLVEALRYKPEVRGFDSRWCNQNLSLT